MRKNVLRAGLLAAAVAATPVMAQRPLNIEVGAFGQFNLQDKELNIDNGPTIGGRLGLYLLKNLALEGDVQFGKADWQNGANTTSLTLTPWAARLVYGIPLNEKTRFLLGAGYQMNVYDGRVRQVTGNATAPNEYEDAVTGLLGIKYCMNDKWNFRVDGVGDYNPSPNFTGDVNALDGKAINLGLRAGIGTMLSGDCPNAPFMWTLAIAPASSRHLVGETEQLNVTMRDGKGNAIPMSRVRDYRCVSDNPNVATIDATGKVTAVAPGTATITCSGMVNGVMQSASHTITVRKPDWRLAVNGGGTFDVGQGTRVTAVGTDERNQPVNGNIAWSSSNSAVATVDNQGNVRCVAGGSVTITGTMTYDGDTRSGTTTVNCNAPPPPPPPRAALVVNLSDVHFAFNQAGLTRAGRDTLNWVIGQLNSAAGSGMTISVEGHTDPYGSETYNQRLSERRAKTVYDFLTRRNGGVDASRIGAQAGFGERCLRLDDDRDRPSRSKPDHGVNRRVELWDLKGTSAPSGCRPASDYDNR